MRSRSLSLPVSIGFGAAIAACAGVTDGQVVTPLPPPLVAQPMDGTAPDLPLFGAPVIGTEGLELLPAPPPAPSTPLVAPTAPASILEAPELSAGKDDGTAADASVAAAAEPPAPESSSDDSAEATLAAEPIAYHWYQPQYWFGPSPWDSGIELGLNGASGTSESISFRTGGYVKRSADDYKFNGSLYYNKTQSEGVEIQSNALLDLRYDWLFDDSPWTLFVMSQTFYDEFQAFDINYNINTGFGYKWLDRDWTSLTTSVGTGASREFGGPDSEWIQEASFSFDYELKVGDNKKFYAKVDHFPEWDDFSNYRVLADVGMEFELHQPSNVSLKLSATDRYDSQPQGVEPHNLNYSALLIWKL